MKVCNQCGREFVPSSRHAKCPACRSKNANKICECGEVMSKNAIQCRSCAVRTGASNFNWKGGTTKHHKGYVMRRLPDHPRAIGSGYVFEHILVMEEHLGRQLYTGETVHHINGQRDDNRLENLELWCKPQPSGIRAEDAYKHALEIIERYGSLYG